MSRPVVLSNGHILVGLDDSGTVHDFYFPYVGLDNLTNARNLNHKIGVWVDGQFSWLDDGSWEIAIDFEEDALVSDISAQNDRLALKLHFTDFVDCHYPAFCRIIEVSNQSENKREIRIFMHQVFEISRAGRGDTALYIPDGNYLLDYKGRCSLLIYAEAENHKAFDQFAVGNYGIENKEGTFRDAEDGELSGNLVEHGGVDTVLRVNLEIDGGQSQKTNYWVVAADSQYDGEAIHKELLDKGLASRLESTRQSFHDWMSIGQNKINQIDERYRKLAKKSLLVIKAHADRHGGIIASSDSSIYNYGRDYYCYVWPRDGAYAILPLIKLGYSEEPKKFFEFCADTLHPHGFMMHKYQPDRAVGSTWHPQMHYAHPELPIQEDETAIVVYALCQYLEISGDDDFGKAMYPRLIKLCADSMADFIDDTSSLPHPSYDLWEQKFATFTYTVFLTMKALESAAKVAEKLNKPEDYDKWMKAVDRIKQGQHLLFNEDRQAFRKSVLLNANGEYEYDNTIDASSFFGAFFYSGKDGSESISKSVTALESVLFNSTPIGGLPRYEHDDYFLKDNKFLGNPWVVTSLWLAQYYIKSGQKDKALDILNWASARTTHSGMLAEQVDPQNGNPIGVDPLVWSHSTFIDTVLMLSE